MKKKRTFEIFETKEEAENTAKKYKMKNYTITPWSNEKKTESGFVLWYKY